MKVQEQSFIMVWFVDPSEPRIPSSRRQRFQGIVDVPEFNESLGLSQLFLVKDSTIWNDSRVKLHSNRLKCCPYVWEVQCFRRPAISVEHEMDRRHEIAEGSVVLPLPFEGPKEGQMEQLEECRCVGCEAHNSHSGRVKKIHHITGEV
jgi:hypothetical protein